MQQKRGWLRSLIYLLLIFLLLSSCSPNQQEKLIPPPSISDTPITPQPKANCPSPNSKVTMVEAETPLEIEQAISNYLNQGGAPEHLQKEIKKLQDKRFLGPSQTITIDTSGDGINEIVLAINFAPLRGGSYLDVHGNLYIYNCTDDQYDVIQIVAGEFADTLEILAIENLLGSDAPEILIKRRWSYLDSYYEFVELYMLKGDGWILSFKTYEVRCGIQTELKDGSNGRKELIIISRNEDDCSDESLIGTTSTYIFDDNEVKLIHDESSSSP